jgi:hypothetical protein
VGAAEAGVVAVRTFSSSLSQTAICKWEMPASTHRVVDEPVEASTIRTINSTSTTATKAREIQISTTTHVAADEVVKVEVEAISKLSQKLQTMPAKKAKTRP